MDVQSVLMIKEKALCNCSVKISKGGIPLYCLNSIFVNEVRVAKLSVQSSISEDRSLKMHTRTSELCAPKRIGEHEAVTQAHKETGLREHFTTASTEHFHLLRFAHESRCKTWHLCSFF